MPARIEQFVGDWLELPDEQPLAPAGRTGGAQLGAGDDRSAAHAWARQHKFRVVLGPLRREQFQSMLPGGASLPKLAALVRNYVGDELRWDAAAHPEGTRSRSRCDLGRRAARHGRRGSVMPGDGGSRGSGTRSSAGRASGRALAERQPTAQRGGDEHVRDQPRRAVRQAQHRWPTRRSRAPPSSASCAATRTSSWCTGSTRSCSSRTRTCTASCAHFQLDPSRLARGHDRGARPAAARRDLDLRSFVARRGSGRARLGLRHADVRRHAGAHRPPGASGMLKTPACATRCCGISREFEKIKADRLTEELRRDRRGLAGRRRWRASDGTGRGAAPGRGQRRHGAGGDGQAGGAEAVLAST